MDPCNTAFGSVLCLGLGWDVETCPWQGEGLQLEKELKSESCDDYQSTGFRQLPQALMDCPPQLQLSHQAKTRCISCDLRWMSRAEESDRNLSQRVLASDHGKYCFILQLAMRSMLEETYCSYHSSGFPVLFLSMDSALEMKERDPRLTRRVFQGR